MVQSPTGKCTSCQVQMEGLEGSCSSPHVTQGLKDALREHKGFVPSGMDLAGEDVKQTPGVVLGSEASPWLCTADPSIHHHSPAV